MALSYKCEISRCSLCNTISDSALAFCLTSSLFIKPAAGEVPDNLRAKSHGWGDRGLPLGTFRHRAAWFFDSCLSHNGNSDIDFRSILPFE